jgi:HK97 family phage portal protein
MIKFFRNLFTKQSSKFNDIAITSYTDGLMYGKSTPENFAVHLGAYTNESYVYGCVYLIAAAIAGLNWKLYKKDSTGKKVEVINLLVSKLFEKPNDNDENSTWYNQIEWTVACLELVGNAYWLLDKLYGTNKRYVGAIQNLIPSKIRIMPNTSKDEGRSFVSGYSYLKDNGMPYVFNNDEITHFKYIRPDDYFYGQGAVVPSAIPIDLIREAETTNLNLFKNGAMPSGALETDKTVDDIRYKRIKAEFDAKYKGTKNANRTLILDNGLKYKQISQSMKDLEFIQGIKLSREEICIAFKVPPLLIGILDNASYSNYEQAVKIFWVHCIIPKVRRIEQVISTIVKRFDDKLYFEFDLSTVEALKDNQEQLSTIAQRYFNIGIPLNQIIAALNLPFEDIEGGDTGYIPFSLMPISEIENKTTEVELPEGEPTVQPPITQEPKSKSWLIRKEMLWKQFDRMTRVIENSYKRVIDKYFSALEQDTISELNKSFTKKKAGDYLFNRDEEIKKWFKQNKKYQKLAFIMNGKREMENIGLGAISFQVNNPRAEKWLDENSLDNAKDVIGSLHDDLKEQLNEGFEAGESIPDIVKRIQNVYDGYDIDGYKAERIARTEVISASNAGALEAYEQSGLKLLKGWLGELDDKIRDSHIKATLDYTEEKAIPMDEDFVLAGGSGPAPGQIDDTNGEENINCRCTIFAIRDTGE